MGKKVVIETDECIGCESCVEPSFARRSLNLMKKRKKLMSNSLRGARKNALRKLFRHARLNAFIGKRSKTIFTKRRKYEAEEDERQYLLVGRHRLGQAPIRLPDSTSRWNKLQCLSHPGKRENCLSGFSGPTSKE